MSAGLQFESAGGGGAPAAAAASFWESTVGPTGDFANVEAARAAGKFRILVTEDTTEPADVALASGGDYSIGVIPGVNYDLGDNQYTFAGAANIYLVGHGRASQFTFAATSANQEAIDTGAFPLSSVTWIDMRITNNSTQSGCHPVKEDCITVMRNILFEPPNVGDCGIHINNAISSINDITVISPGTTASNVIYAQSGQAKGLIFSGNFNTATNSTVCRVGLNNAVTDVTFNGNGQLFMDGDSLATNVVVKSGTANIRFSGGANQVDNYQAGANGTINFSNQQNNHICNSYSKIDFGGSENKVVNHRFPSSTSDSFDKTHFVNCQFTSLTMSSSSDLNIFDNCYWSSSLSISGDDNQFNACRSNTSQTVTVNAGSDRNVFNGYKIDQPIVDNGTDTVQTNVSEF